MRHDTRQRDPRRGDRPVRPSRGRGRLARRHRRRRRRGQADAPVLVPEQGRAGRPPCWPTSPTQLSLAVERRRARRARRSAGPGRRRGARRVPPGGAPAGAARSGPRGQPAARRRWPTGSPPSWPRSSTAAIAYLRDGDGRRPAAPCRPAAARRALLRHGHRHRHRAGGAARRRLGATAAGLRRLRAELLAFLRAALAPCSSADVRLGVHGACG